MNKWNNTVACGKFILVTHLCFLLTCMIIRISEIMICSHLMLEENKGDYAKIAEGILRGSVFDNSVSSMILLLPITILGLLCTFGIIRKKAIICSAIFIGILYSLSVAVSVGNIPYVTYKMSNLCLADLSYLGKPEETFGMMTGEPIYFAFFIAGLIVIAGIIYIIIKFAQRTNIVEDKHKSFHWQSLIATLLCIVLFFAMGRGNSKSLKKGSIIGKPLTFNFAIYSDDAFLNLAAQSPTFGLLKELPHKDRRINTGISDQEATTFIQALQRRTISSLTDSCTKKKNVVMVLMESMSANYMGTFGNNAGLTPCIDSLFANSHAFYNAWSNGARTSTAIFSTQTSLPGCLNLNMLETPLVLNHKSMAPILSGHGYSTDLFISHDKGYDNIELFFKSQPFDKIHSEEEYGFKEMHWGVRDSTLFGIAIDSIRQFAKDTTNPFYTVILTCSNHPAFSIPSPYCDMYPEMEQCAVRYADTSIDTFMKRASKEPWFDNTIFVFTGDHGKVIGKPDGLTPTSQNHVPIFFYGKDITPVKDSSLMLQTDLVPTILGSLGLQCPDYSGFGINRMKMTRDTAIYTVNNYFIARTKDKAYYLDIETNVGTQYDVNKDFTLSNPTTVNIPELDKLIKCEIQALYTYWRY